MDELVAEAAPETLPLSEAVRGFDGDAWVWIWREWLQMPDEAVAQVTRPPRAARRLPRVLPALRLRDVALNGQVGMVITESDDGERVTFSEPARCLYCAY